MFAYRAASQQIPLFHHQAAGAQTPRGGKHQDLVCVPTIATIVIIVTSLQKLSNKALDVFELPLWKDLTLNFEISFGEGQMHVQALWL
jgi:hypothetical protein